MVPIMYRKIGNTFYSLWWLISWANATTRTKHKPNMHNMLRLSSWSINLNVTCAWKLKEKFNRSLHPQRSPWEQTITDFLHKNWCTSRTSKRRIEVIYSSEQSCWSRYKINKEQPSQSHLGCALPSSSSTSSSSSSPDACPDVAWSRRGRGSTTPSSLSESPLHDKRRKRNSTKNTW